MDYTDYVMKVLDHLGIDTLVPIGGDDTLSYGVRLHKEGFPVVAIPKTMDNDVFGTDYCIGFSTAVTRSVDFITNMRTSVGSHERIGIVELFGRNSGETSLITAYLAYVDRAIITEVPFNIDKLCSFLEGRQAQQPVQLRHHDDLGRRHHGRRRRDRNRRGRCLRSPQAGWRWRNGVCRRSSAAPGRISCTSSWPT